MIIKLGLLTTLIAMDIKDTRNAMLSEMGNGMASAWVSLDDEGKKQMIADARKGLETLNKLSDEALNEFEASLWR